METPILETSRIILRPLKMKDADEIFKNWTSDPEVAKFMIWNLHENVDVTKEWLKSEEENRNGDTNYTFAFIRKETGELFGSGGIAYKESNGIYEIGYNIMKKYWNQGYTTEACKEIIRFASKELGIKNFLGRHAIENPGSGKVMEKNGFVFQKQSSYQSFDGTREYKSNEYLLKIE